MMSIGLSFRTMTGMLRCRAVERPEREAFLFLADGEREEARLTYEELDRRARAIALNLRESLEPGDRALLLYPPGLELIAAFFGCLYAGVVAVPAYPPRPGDRSQSRLRAIARDAEPRAALTTQGFAARVPELGALHWIATETLETPEGLDLPEPDPESIALLQYTSGSTATPKGVMVTHANLLHNEAMIGQAFRQDEGSVVVGWLPLYHDMGLIGNVLQPIHAGARCVLMSPTVFLQRPRRWLEAISRYRGTTSGGPNFAYELCLRKIPPEQREGLDLSSWRVAFNGAEPVRAETLERFAEAFASCGFRREAFYPCYGLAEATLFVTGPHPRGGGPGVKGRVSCGHAWNGQRIAIVDPETGAELPAGREGEIWISGPSVARGYWRNPEATERDFRARLASGEGPFLRTGDLGFLLDGELYVTGRIKDLVILRGRNHYPQDLELTAERSHPDLRPGCGAAFSVEVNGEERLVLVQEVERHRREGFGELAEAVRRTVAEEHEVQAHEVVLVRVGAVPKTSSGKVQRRLCRELYLAGELAVLGRSALADLAGAPPVEAVSPGLVPTRGALLALEPEERRAVLERFLRERAAPALGVPLAAIDPRRPLTGLGLDSLAAMELKGSIEAALGVPLPLPQLLEGAGTAEMAELLLPAFGKGTADEGAPGVPKGTAETGDLPLSQGQKALWFLHRLAPEAGAYNIAVAARARNGLDIAALRRSLEALALRHPALRSTFVVPDGSDEPVRRVLEEPEIDFRVEEAADWSEACVKERLAEEAWRPFDLDRGPLVRVRVFDRGTGDPLLLLAVHHLAADLASFAVAARDLAALYRNEADRLPALPASYTGFVRWQEELLSGPRGDRLWSFWREALAGLPDLDLPADRPRPPVQTWRGGARALELPPGLAAELRALAAEQGATLFMLLLAAFQAQLGRYAGQEDLAVGSPAAGRSRADLAPLMGYFVNPLALRADLSGNPTFAELLERTRRAVLAALEHADFPFALVAERLRPARDPSRSPVFQVMFLLQRSRPGEEPGLATFALGEAGGRLDLGGLELESLRLEERRAPFDLTLRVAEEAGGRLRAALEHNADFFDGATAERMLGHFRTLLEGAVAVPMRPVSGLPLMSPAERHQVLVDWNEPAGQVPEPPRLLHQPFEAQAARTPDAEALVAGRERTTYAELNRRANQLARHLRSLGVEPEVRVGVRLERTTELVVSLLAVLKAGGAYVPLDPASPRERLEGMLEDSGVRVVIGPGGDVRPSDRRILDRYDGSDLAPSALPGNLAYLIYTSGSTGRPKAVAIEHRSASVLVGWARRVFSPEELAGVLASTSVAFDLSVFELFVPLSCGGRVILADNALELPRLPAKGEVTLVNTVPSAMAELVRSVGVPGSVRTVNLAGEPIPPPLVEAVHGLPGLARLYNLYGPSEDTTYSTFTRIARGEAVSIGRPIAGTCAYVLAAGGEPVPVGVPGELYLGGEGLARGYLGRPELTAERFVPNPFEHGRGGGRLYRTGDVVRRRPDGRLDFLGRIDHQVKVRGFRVELGEVEAALARHRGVREAAVLALDEAEGGKRLVAFVVPRGEEPLSPAALRAFLRESLPDFMVPTGWAVLPELPLSPNGKVDRRALARMSPGTGPSAGAPGDGEPRTPLEARLGALFAEVLGRPRVGLHESFFELGGHSLLATRVAVRVKRDLGIDLPVSALFQAPTVAGLAERLAAAPGGSAARALPRRAGTAPLSFAQQRLWFLHQLAPRSAAYHVPGVLTLAGRLHPGVLAAALGEIVRRHEALRTVFVLERGEPVQVVLPPRPAGERPLPLVDLGGLPAGRRIAEAGRLGAAEARRPFGLATGPLLRTLLLRLAKGEHRLTVVMHHIVSDGWSLGVMLDELAALYDAFAAGRPSPLPPLPLQYADFAAAQRQEAQALEGQLAYWREQLAGAPALELPADRPRAAVLSDRGAALGVALGPELTRGLQNLARREGATPFMVLLAAWWALLHRSSGQDDLTVGCPVAGRDRPEVEPLIGCFVNTLPMRVRLEGEPSFRELLGQVRAVALAAYDHQGVPFERIVEELAPARELGRTPLFQVLLALRDASRPLPRPAGLELSLDEIPTGAARLDLTLMLGERADGAGIEGTLEYRADLFEAATAARLIAHLQELLAAALREPERLLSELPLLTEAERQQILREWSARDVPFPQATIPALFEEQAARRPDAPAVEQGEERWTYSELNAAANRLAHRLRRLGAGPEGKVGLLLDRSVELVAGMLAALKAGGAYLPLDPADPAERLSFLLADARPAVVVTRRDLIGNLEAPPRRGPGPHILLLDDPENALAEESGENPAPWATADHLAYVLYTSGSTGRPKGVEGTHRAVVRLVRPDGESGHARYGPEEVFLHLASPLFDAATLEVWGPLLSGGRLVVLPGRVPALAALAEILAGHGVTTLFLTTGLFHLIAEERVEILRPLRRLLVGGEVIRPSHVRRALEVLEDGELVNGYGPTENTTFTTAHALRRGSALDEPVPIGRPIAATRVHLLDRWMRPVPVGVPGELYAGGDGLARGYLARPELTAERFVPDPFGPPGGRLYRTGDLARWRPDGAIEFLGRMDQQVKIRGFRVEPGEVEMELARHPRVASAAVLAREDLPGGRGLAAFVVRRPSGGPQDAVEGDLAAALRAHLAARLPAPMMPALFIELPELPLNANGKVDRRALARLDLRPGAGGGAARKPTLTEERLRTLWREVLKRDSVDSIGLDDDFFALGGHSLLGARLASRVREAFGVDLPLARIFAAPTLAGQARAVDELRAGGLAGPEPIRPVPRSPSAALPLSFAQERLWIVDRLQGGSAVYNIPLLARLCGDLAVADLAAAFGAIVRRHETLRTTFAGRDGEPIQVVGPPPPRWPLPLVDLSELAAETREREARALAGDEARRPFDLAAGPVLRTHLLRMGAGEHLLLLNVHHIAADGWSMGLLVRELGELYGALRKGTPPRLPELPVGYADFAVWQRQRLRGEVLEREAAWWRERLRGLPALDLPTDRPRPAVQTFRGGEVPVVLDPALSRELVALARQEGATPFMALLAAFSALLSCWSGQRDLAIGSPVAGRDRPEVQDLIGFFVNSLVLRSDLSGDPGFRGLLRRVRQAALDAYAHRELPFEKLVGALQPRRRDLSRAPLFQVALALQDVPLPARELPGLDLHPQPLPTGTAKFDLTLDLREDEGDGFAGSLEFAADLYDRGTALRLVDRLRELLRSAVADPGLPLSRLTSFPEAERRQVLAEEPAPQPPVPQTRESLPPRDELERTLAAALREVLGLDRVGVRETFFEMGGNSLAMIRLHSRLERALGREVPIAILFQHPTIESLARRLAEQAEETDGTGEKPQPEAAARDRTELRRESLRRVQQARGPLRRPRASGGTRHE
jgi:amino acid adenylation domain-containing protein